MSVEQACETHLMGLLAPAQASGAPLEGIEFRHHDDDVPAILDCIVFKGKFEDNILEGTKLSDGRTNRKGEVKLTFASGTKTPAQSDVIAAAMENYIYNQTLWPQNLVFPGEGYIEPESTSEREDGAKVRKRIFTVPMLALYIPPNPDLMFLPSSDPMFTPSGDFMFV